MLSESYVITGRAVELVYNIDECSNAAKPAHPPLVSAAPQLLPPNYFFADDEGSKRASSVPGCPDFCPSIVASN